MAGGQAITSGQGTLVYNEGDVLAGSEATSAAGTATLNRLVPLRSRKVGGGTASAVLSGQASNSGTGTLVYLRGFALTGQASALAQGTLLYRGRVTIGWNANPESDVAGYRIYHSTVSGSFSPPYTDAGNVTTIQINDLPPGMTHYFVVTAYDTSNNESENSVEVSKVF